MSVFAELRGDAVLAVYIDLKSPYAYLAAGPRGLVVVDIERPEEPRVEMVWNADGALRDTRDVKLASTNASLFAYIADGRNGLRIVQLTAPERNPTLFGWSPKPDPQLNTRTPQGCSISLRYFNSSTNSATSRGYMRDRA